MADRQKRQNGGAGATDGRPAARESRDAVSADPVQTVDPGTAARAVASQAPDAGDAQEPPSPCISVCALDENDVCMGCYRTAGEITDWFMATPAEKRAILRAAGARRAADSPIRLL